MSTWAFIDHENIPDFEQIDLKADERIPLFCGPGNKKLKPEPLTLPPFSATFPATPSRPAPMNKKDLHQHVLSHLGGQAKALEAAARKTASLATDEEHKARGKYETFSLETSYLARGQAQRVEDIRSALATLRAMPIRELPGDADIQPGALVEVTDQTGATDIFWFVPAGGGEEIDYHAHRVQLLTPNSPLARALSTKRAGDTLTFNGRSLRIQSVR
jgi:transcription elongation GreA/GreB family factor